MTHSDFDTLVKARRVLAQEMSDTGLFTRTSYGRLLVLAFRSLNRVIDFCQHVFELVDSVESEV